MKIVRPMQLSINQRVLEHNRKFYLTVSATLGINLETSETIMEFDYAEGMYKSMGEMPMPDPGMPKPQGEFLVSGSFFSPNQKPIEVGNVKIKLGRQEKELYVFGNRGWKTIGYSKPESFTSLPIDYKYSFGGEAYAKNPAGIGFKDGILPNIEDPRKLITSSGATPDPAGFGPQDIMVPQRSQYTGTYDNYLEKYFPGYPEDFKWEFFLAAPQDQWIKGFYLGNEDFEIYNMHPEIPVLKGKFPNLTSRCFLKHQITPKKDQVPEAEFSELKMKLDTIWFFPEHKLATLTWRGVIEVYDDEASQVTGILAAYESRDDTPRTIEEYQKSFEARVNTKDGLLNYFKTEDLIPFGTLCAMELLQKMAMDGSGNESEFSKNFDAKIKDIEEQVEEKLKESEQQVVEQLAKAPDEQVKKLDAKELFNPKPGSEDEDSKELKQKMEAAMPGITSGDPGKIELKNFSFDKIDEIMLAVDTMIQKKQKVIDQEMEKSTLEMKKQLDELKAKAAENEIPPEKIKELEEKLALIDKIGTEIPPLPRVNTEEIAAGMADSIEDSKKNIEKMKSQLALGNPYNDMLLEQIKRMDESVKQTEEILTEAAEAFKETYIIGAHFAPKGKSPHKESLETVKEKLLEAIRTGQDIRNGDYACIDLSGENLDGVDFSGSLMEQINFTDASLKGANFSDCILARANLQKADFTGANFDGANVGAVHAQLANFTEAKFTNSAKLSKGNFSEANFTQAELNDVELLETVFEKTNFSETKMPALTFIEISLPEVNFNGAQIEKSTFINCDLTRANFKSALANNCTFIDPLLERSCFDQAYLESACFVNAPEDDEEKKQKGSLKNASFVQANMNRINLMRMELTEADFSNCTMEEANFSEANLTKANLTKVQARTAQFRKAKLTNANLDQINLWEGSLAKAHLVGASFKGANLAYTDFLRSTMGNTNFQDANLDQTLIKDWRPA